MKQHDDPEDTPRPLADLSQHLPPPFPVPSQALPEKASTDLLTTHTVTGSTHRSILRQEYARNKVLSGCFAGEDPVIHVEHPPHILEPLERSPSVSVPASTAGEEVSQPREPRLLDQVLGRKRRLEVVVELPLYRRRILV